MKWLGRVVIAFQLLVPFTRGQAQTVKLTDLVGPWIRHAGVQEENGQPALVNGRPVDVYDTLYFGADSTYYMVTYNKNPGAEHGKYLTSSPSRWNYLRGDTISFSGESGYKIIFDDKGWLEFFALKDAMGGPGRGLFERPFTAASGPTATADELIGAWDLVPELGASRSARDTSVIYERLTVQANGSQWWRDEVRIVRGDTLSCSGIMAHRLPDMLALVGTREGFAGIVVKDRQLRITYNNPRDRAKGPSVVYQRIEPARSPFSHLIATGFSLGPVPVPAHATKATGALTDALGLWESDLLKREPFRFRSFDSRIIREALVIRPDSTIVHAFVDARGDGSDTVGCARAEKIVSAQQVGDSLFLDRGTGDGRLMLYGQQLIFFPTPNPNNAFNRAPVVYKPKEP